MMLGAEYRALLRFALASFVWVTVVWLPLGLLLALEVRFLPYHDVTITWLHRTAVVGDLALLWAFFPQMLARQRGTAAGGALTFLRRAFASWIKRDSDPAPKRGGSRPLLLITLATGGTALFVATVPGERIEKLAMASAPSFLIWTPAPELREIPSLAITHWLFDAPGALLHRDLQLAEQVLTTEPPGEGLLAELDRPAPSFAKLQLATGFSLTGRDLRRADLRRARLLNTDLRGASLEGADLREATIAGVDLRPLDVTDGSACASSRQLMNVEGAGSPSERATAAGNPFEVADLTPPSEASARLCWSSLRGARLDGARILRTDLRLARLDGANLRGARLVEVRMEGAEASWVDLSHATGLIIKARNAQLQGS